jgi:hypothetical protein
MYLIDWLCEALDFAAPKLYNGNFVHTWLGCCPGPSPALITGMLAVAAAILAAPLSKCRNTIISE